MTPENAIQLPLWGFFERLKATGYSLGMEEYTLLLQALGGDSTYPKSDDELLLLCKHLWYKPGENEKLFEEWFWDEFEVERSLSKAKLKEEERIIEARKVQKNPGRQEVLDRRTTVTQEPEYIPDVERKPEPKPRKEESESSDNEIDSSHQSSELIPGDDGLGNDDDSIYLNIHAASQRKASIALSQAITPPSSVNFSFEGGFKPMTERELKNSWRYLPARQIRQQFNDEIDVRSTVRAIAKTGEQFFAGPIFKEKDGKEAGLFILIDHLGSMVAFEEFAKDVERSAREWFSKQFSASGIRTYYFQNVPETWLYLNTSHTRHHKVAHLQSTFALYPVPILIISDGGAAKGQYEPERIKDTVEALDQLKRFSSRIAWLNPLPAKRWEGTSAEPINRMLEGSMCEANPAGFMRAINILRGKIHH